MSRYVRQGACSALNISTATVVMAPGPGDMLGRARIARVNVVTAGSTAGGVFDTASVAAATTANQVAAIPNTVGSYLVDFPLLQGLVVVPGTGQVLSVSYDG